MARTTFRSLTLLAAFTGLTHPMLAAAQSTASDFTTGTRYDKMRRVTGTIRPDPDGAGTLKYAAVRNTYDAAGRLTKVEEGELSSWKSEDVEPSAWTGFTIHRVVEFTYDSLNRKTKELVSKGVNKYALTQYSYDAFDRLLCTAVRMNPVTFASPEPDACATGTAGSFGPDRITRNVYDDAGRLLKVQKAYDTPLQQDYVTYTYTGNGKQEYVTDARGYKARFIYDGHDRLFQWNFPSKTSTGVTSSTDYEAYQYDEAGNRNYFRRRDGQVITYTHDALNRMTTKDIPGGTAADVYYGYDLTGAQLFARFGSISGEGVTNVYDGFNRITSSSSNMGGTARTLTYQYDANGNRTRVTHPDSTYFVYDYDGLDRLTAIKQAGGASQIGIAYNPQGRRATLTRGGGGATSYGYDDVYRLTSLAHAGTDAVTYGFTYNPASQAITRSVSNDVYAYQGYSTATRSYTRNGLNQYTAVAGTTHGYDSNGNLTSDGATTYTYDAENRLTGASGAKTATLKYDPLGRLWETSGGTAGTTRFVYDGDALVAEYGGTGTLLRRYVHGDGVDEPLLWYEGEAASDTTRRYLRADYLGSVIAVTNNSGVTLETNTYDAYGVPGADNEGRFQYTGQTWLPEIGLYYYKARAYSPQIGRFLQIDSIGYQDQINLYAYVGNDPLNGLDPTGNATAPAKVCGVAAPCRMALKGVVGYIVRSIVSVFSGSDRKPRGETLFRGLSKRDITNLEKYSAILPANSSSKATPDGHILGVPSRFVSMTRDINVAIRYANTGTNATGYVISIDASRLPGIIDVSRGEQLKTDDAKDLAIGDSEVLTGMIPSAAITGMKNTRPTDNSRRDPQDIICGFNCTPGKYPIPNY